MPETTKTDDTSETQGNNNNNGNPSSLGVPIVGSRPSSVALSPAVSAFQFKPNHLRHNRSMERLDSAVTCRPIGSSSGGSNHHLSTSLDMKRSHSNRTMHNNTRAKSPVSPRPSVTTGSCIIKDGYVYKDEIVILDEKKKEELLKVGEIRLQSEWTFWYDRYVPNLSASEYEANLQVISTTGSVQKFWSVYNNIDGPDRLGFRSNLHFMRKGIKPIWEDPQNENGGSYNFKIPKHHSPLAWRDLLVLLIGEKVEGWLGDVVCGVSVSSRQQCDNYQIWTAHNHQNDPEADARVKAKLIDVLRPAEIQSFYYKVHKNHAAFQKQQQHPNKDSNTTSTTSSTLKLKSPFEMRQKITEQSIEKVVADIERLGLKKKQQQQQQQQQQNNTNHIPNHRHS
ncbi:translation initiation factor eIF4e [Lichtheimia hyalospora FSU 10163]|nr:translation initiation factor eIF4e [Lichtheimia hyalospora FSU 10163]